MDREKCRKLIVGAMPHVMEFVRRYGSSDPEIRSILRLAHAQGGGFVNKKTWTAERIALFLFLFGLALRHREKIKKGIADAMDTGARKNRTYADKNMLMLAEELAENRHEQDINKYATTSVEAIHKMPDVFEEPHVFGIIRENMKIMPDDVNNIIMDYVQCGIIRGKLIHPKVSKMLVGDWWSLMAGNPNPLAIKYIVDNCTNYTNSWRNVSRTLGKNPFAVRLFVYNTKIQSYFNRLADTFISKLLVENVRIVEIDQDGSKQYRLYLEKNSDGTWDRTLLHFLRFIGNVGEVSNEWGFDVGIYKTIESQYFGNLEEPLFKLNFYIDNYDEKGYFSEPDNYLLFCKYVLTHPDANETHADIFKYHVDRFLNANNTTKFPILKYIFEHANDYIFFLIE